MVRSGEVGREVEVEVGDVEKGGKEVVDMHSETR